MGKRADPLRAPAQTSRVEKLRRTYRDSRTLPSWYYQVQNIYLEEDREVRASDFDEDLSELDDVESKRDDTEQLKKDEQLCTCSSQDSQCGCQAKDDDMDKGESERSYDGSNADDYYELKDEREERKREKLQERKTKDRKREMERLKEEEVHAADRSLKRAEKERKTIPIESLAGQGFKLFCSSHVDQFYSDLYATKRVDFYHLDDEGGEAGMLYGDVYLDANANCGFGPFCPPKHASRKAVKVKSWDSMYELSFKFIGNSYLKLRVSRDLVFMNPYRASSAAPKVFEFVGIRRDREKEKEERQEMLAKARRSPSPRESWFEMNHPMGWWHQ